LNFPVLKEKKKKEEVRHKYMLEAHSNNGLTTVKYLKSLAVRNHAHLLELRNELGCSL
jgi:hypothetical protein